MDRPKQPNSCSQTNLGLWLVNRLIKTKRFRTCEISKENFEEKTMLYVFITRSSHFVRVTNPLPKYMNDKLKSIGHKNGLDIDWSTLVKPNPCPLGLHTYAMRQGTVRLGQLQRTSQIPFASSVGKEIV